MTSTLQTDSTLNPEHKAMLDASAIAPEVAVARGYRSIGTAEARDLGFKGQQARPGLLVPRWTVFGEQDGYQLRPNEPRERTSKSGKVEPIKYETPRGQANRLDVHPSMLARVRSGRELVFITEGAKKVDCLASFNIPAINLPGVWGWRGKNERGGKTALDDWAEVNIAGSMFVLAFDADVVTKPDVHKALSSLQSYLLARKAARVYVLNLPADGPKGIDDFIAAWKASKS